MEGILQGSAWKPTPPLADPSIYPNTEELVAKGFVGVGILLSCRGRFEDESVVLTEVEEDEAQVGIISSLLNDDVSDVLRSVFVDGPYVLSSSSSFELGMLVDAERRAKAGVVKSSREVDPGWVIGGVDSGRLNGAALGGDDANLERNFLVGETGGGA